MYAIRSYYAENMKKTIKAKNIDKEITLGIRPEDLKISLDKLENSFLGTSLVSETLGSDDYVSVLPRDAVKGDILTARILPDTQFPLDREVWLKPNEKIHIF